MYLIYDNEQDAWDRSEQQGAVIGLRYSIDGTGTRWVTVPVETTNGKFALDVRDFTLTESEQSSTVSTIQRKTLTLPTE